MGPKNLDGMVPALVDPTMDPVDDEVHDVMTEPVKRPPMEIVWRNVVIMAILHVMALYGVYLLPSAMPLTWAWTGLMYWMSAMGITAGAHRLWSHKSYTARLPLRIFLAICQTMASQNDIIEWSRDHRVHHKYSETEADPHNATRGFFFSHMGWLLVRKHPDVKSKGKNIDISDLLNDPVCVWQRKVYLPAMLFLCYVFPTIVPMWCWGESFQHAYFIPAVLRYIAELNATWLVNSAAHMYGNKPYDKHIHPSENIFVSIGAVGEGFHNYHHTFPQDYATSEYGWKINITCMFIDCMAAIGLVTSRKSVSRDVVRARQNRTGDGTQGFGGMSNMLKGREKVL